MSALSSDIYDAVFDGKKSGTAVPYCGGTLTAIAGNAQSSDALSGLQQLTLSTRGFAFGGTNNALTLNGVTAAEVLADTARIESGLVRTAPPSVNQFAATTPSMNDPRAGATATLLPNGKVLIAGGAGASTELYDPVTDTFAASTPSMNDPRSGAPATLLPNGKVLIAGGFDNEGNSLSSTELYNPATNTFALPASTPVMNTARADATATLLPNGKVLIAGGYIGSPPYSLASTELYDPVSNTFAPSASTAVMNNQRIADTATLLSNRLVLIAGGYNYNPSTPLPGSLASTELYNPVTNKFAPPASTPVMTVQREYATATLLPNGKVLVAGGEVAFEIPDDGAELYNPQTNAFVALTSTPGLNIFATATLLPDGKVLIAGGQNIIFPHFYASLDATALYNPATNTFEASPVMNAARDSATATLLTNGKVLIAGGQYFYGSGTSLKSTELYTP